MQRPLRILNMIYYKMHNMKNLALLLGLGLAAQSPCAYGNDFRPTSQIHVSTVGSDQMEGSEENPVQTLKRAVELARQHRTQSPQTAIEVLIHQGEYLLPNTIELTHEDSGTAEAPTVYKAANGEKVVISGAIVPKRLGSARQFPEYNRLSGEAVESLIVYELPRAHEQAWQTHPHGEAHSLSPASLELFAHGRQLARASFPSQGWLTNDGESALSTTVGLHQASGFGWLHGFPANDYQDEYGSLDQFDAAQWRVGARYRIENTFSGLTRPGQWLIDEENRRLLWWPDGTADEELRCSNLETLVSLYDVDHVRLEGIEFEGARVQAIEIAGGYQCELELCKVRCVGNVGVNIYHGEEHSVHQCEIQFTGSSAIRVEGGNREGKIECGHLIQNNAIHHCSAKHVARHAAIAVHGVGTNVIGNTVHDHPDWAVTLCGDDNLVQGNHIFNVCRETSDTGAIYMSHDSSYQGNVISLNRLHDIGGFDRRHVAGIYLDQRISNTEVSANLLYDLPRAIIVRGGNHNRLDCNIIHSCWVGVQFEWQADSVGNRLQANAIESENALVVSQSNSLALHCEKNCGSLDHLFVDVRNGNLQFVNQKLAEELGFTDWRLDHLIDSVKLVRAEETIQSD